MMHELATEAAAVVSDRRKVRREKTRARRRAAAVRGKRPPPAAPPLPKKPDKPVVSLGVGNALRQHVCDERLVWALLRPSGLGSSRERMGALMQDLCDIPSAELRYRLLSELIEEKVVQAMPAVKRLRLIGALSRWSPSRGAALRSLEAMPGAIETRINPDTGGIRMVYPQIDTDTATPPGEPVRLSLRVSVRSLLRVDTVGQQFSMRLHMEVWLPIWRHPGLALLDGTTVSPDTWDPKLECLNAVELNEWTLRSSLIEDQTRSRQHIRYAYDVDGVFSETLELNWFPFDRQQMSVKLRLGRRMREAVLEPLGMRPDRDPDRNEAEANLQRFVRGGLLEDNIWTVLHSESFPDRSVWITRPRPDHAPRHRRRSERRSLFPQTLEGDACAVDGSRVDVAVMLRRRSMYYVWNIYLPMFLLTLMTGANVVIPVCEVADRLSVNLTLILTAVAYKFIAAQDLPNVAYLTFIDTHVLVCLASLFVSVLETVVFAAAKSVRGCEGELPWTDVVRAPSTNASAEPAPDDRSWEAWSVGLTVLNLALFLLFNLFCVLAASVFAPLHEQRTLRRMDHASRLARTSV